MANLRSQLEKHQLISRLNDEEVHDYARKAYHQKGLALINLAEINDPYFKQQVINYADTKYGRRK